MLPPRSRQTDRGARRAGFGLATALLIASLGWAARANAQKSADDERPAARPRSRATATAPATASPAPASEADREAAALAFVRTHHPELATLLESLKPMRPTEYDKAIRQIAQVSRSLDAAAATDPERYALGLEAWKARSRVELLTARLVSRGAGGGSNRELESQLRQAVAAQLEVEVRQQRYERTQAEARLKRLTENLRRLETEPDVLIENRYQALIKKSQRASGRLRVGATTAKAGSTAKGRARNGSNPARDAATTSTTSVKPSPAPVPARGDARTSTTTPVQPSEGDRPR